MQPGSFHVPGFQNASQGPWANMPTHVEDWETVNGFGSVALGRGNVGEALHQTAGMQTEQRIKRPNCGNNVPRHHNLIFGSRDQIGSRFAVANGEAEGSMSYAPRTMSAGFHGLTGEGNTALVDRSFPPAESGSGSSSGFQPYHGSPLSSASERESLYHPRSDSLGNHTSSPYTESRSGRRNACKRKSSMDDVIGSVGSLTFRPLLEQRERNFPWLSPEASTSIPPSSSELVSAARIPALDDSSYPRDNITMSQPPRARPLQHLHVGSNRFYGGHLIGSQDVYQTGRGAPMSYMWMSRGLANEHTMPSARSPHDISPFDQGNASSAVVPWCGISGESSMNQLHVHRDFHDGISMGSQARNFANGALRNTFEPSSRGFPGFLYRESTSQRLHPASLAPLYSGHVSSHPPAVQLVRHSGFNAQGGLVPYRGALRTAAMGGNMILGSQPAPENAYPSFGLLNRSGSQPAPGNAYPSFGLLNRSAMTPPFQGLTESVGASPLHDYYGMPLQGLEMLPVHRARGSSQRLPSHESFDHALGYNGLNDIQDHYIALQPDVDNMSYEELLALEERIGNVNTGLSEENMRMCLKTSKHSSYNVTVSVSQESEIKCSICQEEYMEGDELGQLNCSHSYHTRCIKQWLVLKNQCPICKASALSSP